MARSIRRGLGVIATVVAGLLLTGCSEPAIGSDVVSSGAVREFSGAERIPLDFSGTTTTGSTFRSSAERGKVLVVNFWYAGCPPCRTETPTLVAIAKKYANRGVQFVGVNTRDTVGDARPFLSQSKVPYPSVLDADNGRVQLAFARSRLVPPNATPSTVVIDASGRVRSSITGGVPAPDILESLIDTALRSS